MKYILEKDEVERVVAATLSRVLDEQLPPLIRRATRKKWLTTNEAVKILNCSRRHVQHLRDAGHLPFSQHGRMIRYDIDEIERFLQKHKVNRGGEE